MNVHYTLFVVVDKPVHYFFYLLPGLNILKVPASKGFLIFFDAGVYLGYLSVIKLICFMLNCIYIHFKWVFLADLMVNPCILRCYSTYGPTSIGDFSIKKAFEMFKKGFQINNGDGNNMKKINTFANSPMEFESR